MIDRAVSQAIASGLQHLRLAYYYKDTRKRYGPDFPTSILGQAEEKLATAQDRGDIMDGVQLLRRSRAYQKTRLINPLLATFARTEIGKAETQFLRAIELSPVPLPPPQSPFKTMNGLQHINPRGGDDLPAAKRAGFGYVAINVGDWGYAEWRTMVDGAKRLGLKVALWKRTYTRLDCSDLARRAMEVDLDMVIHNYEKEIEEDGAVDGLAAVIEDYPHLWHCWQPDPWIPNSLSSPGKPRQALQRLVATGVIVALECYANQNPAYVPSTLSQHAVDMGIPVRQQTATFGAGKWSNAPHDAPPSLYLKNWLGSYIVYPADSKKPSDWART